MSNPNATNKEELQSIKTSLRLLLAFKINGSSALRSKAACYLVYGWKEKNRPITGHPPSWPHTHTNSRLDTNGTGPHS